MVLTPGTEEPYGQHLDKISDIAGKKVKHISSNYKNFTSRIDFPI
jgi:hypothetical protein